MASSTALKEVNNGIYDELGEQWYHAQDNPVALLRAESRFRNPWVKEEIRKQFPSGAKILDIGCGGGFLSNELAQEGHSVTGMDMSEESLRVAQKYDQTRKVKYVKGDALHLPFADSSFDVVCAMDFLEHVEDPSQVIAEASRVLKAGGIYFFCTFNRNLLSWLLVIKSVEWFVKNTPKNLHVLHLFIKPEELQEICEKRGLNVEVFKGYRPVILSKAVLYLLKEGKVSPDFQFKFCNSTQVAYICKGSKVSQ